MTGIGVQACCQGVVSDENMVRGMRGDERSHCGSREGFLVFPKIQADRAMSRSGVLCRSAQCVCQMRGRSSNASATETIEKPQIAARRENTHSKVVSVQRFWAGIKVELE